MNDAISAIESHRILSRNLSRWAIYGLVLLIFTGYQVILFAEDAIPIANKGSASISAAALSWVLGSRQQPPLIENNTTTIKPSRSAKCA